MPDPYTITLTSDDEDINGTDEIQVIITITVNASASNEAYTFAAKNLYLDNHGSLAFGYEVDNLLMVPGEYDVKIFDKDEYLDGLIFGTTDLDKQFAVELKLNQATFWKGFAEIGDISFDSGPNILSFRATPRMDLLNSTTAYGPGGVVHDPLDYSDTSPVNISAAAHTSGEVLVTHTSDAGFNLNFSVLIAGVVGMDELNGYHIITEETSSTQFKVAFTTDQSYTSGGTCKVMDITGDPYKTITSVLEDIFQVVESTISYGTGQISILHDWLFNVDDRSNNMNQFALSAASHAGGTVTVTHGSHSGQIVTGDDVWFVDVEGMTDLNGHFLNVTVNSNTEMEVTLTTAQTYTTGGQVREIETEADLRDLLINVEDMFFSQNDPVALVNKTVGDVLKSFAFQMGCFTGMIHNNKAFFNKIYLYDSGNLQTLGTVLEEKHEYRYPIITYVEIKAPDEIPQREGTVTESEDQKLVRDDMALYLKAIYPSGFTTSDFKADDITGDPFVVNIRDAETNTVAGGEFLDSANQCARYWYFHRNDPVKTRVDTFLVVGVDYDYIKNFTLNSNKYSVIKMEIDFDNNQTEFEAVYLGAV